MLGSEGNPCLSRRIQVAARIRPFCQLHHTKRSGNLFSTFLVLLKCLFKTQTAYSTFFASPLLILEAVN